jgi:hypothetical protein
MSKHESCRAQKRQDAALLIFEEKKVHVALLPLYIDGNFGSHCIDIDCSL